MVTTVTWVRDSNGAYEVSSPEHLKQIMNKGVLYTDAGTKPSNYWAADYIQTADIDLLGGSADTTPIGLTTENFDGGYDGGNFSISNWSYLDPEFATANDCADRVGLFGHVDRAVFKNMRLSGVWKIQGFKSDAEFLVARTGSICQMFNVECDFSPGTLIDHGGGVNAFAVAGVVGLFDRSAIYGCTLKGSVDFVQADNRYIGGFAAFLLSVSSTCLVQNLATFPTGIRGETAGGIVGESRSANLERCVNAMSGDIAATGHAGGIAGVVNDGSSISNEYLVNAMTGNISSSGTDESTGGIFGSLSSTSGTTYLLNYATGDITQPNAPSRAGGLIGSTLKNGVVDQSINAMNGSVFNSVIGVGFDDSSFFHLTIDTSFGLTFTANAYSTTALPSGPGLLTDNRFPLPYVSLADMDISTTNQGSDSHDLDFVYANLAGNSSHSDYTHLILHKGDVCTPFPVDFDVADTNAILYFTFINSVSQVVFQPNLPIIVPPLLSAVARVINVPVTITEVQGAISYEITYEGPAGGEIVAVTGVTTLEQNIAGVEPGTQYTIRLYADTGAGYDLSEEIVATTLPNSAANYDITDFQENGVTDLTALDAASLANIASVINDLVNTGDVVVVSLEGNPDLSTSFVGEGEAISIVGIDGVLLPFQSASGAGQAVSLTLSDDVTTVPITYDDQANTISVDSITHSTGDTFFLDGNRLEVLDFNGLTVLTVDLAPIIVLPRAINIPVQIIAVPGAVAYRITYEGPGGAEVTAVTGATTLIHNITGVQPETQYTIRLYVDTGAVHELSAELVTTTPPNVAANYDVADITEDGVFNLSNVPEATIESISAVLNDVFATGDVVSVSLESNPGLKTSFIILGDTLSIKEISGVLPPFEEASGAGQDVSVVLSDGATTVAIDYDNAVNTITVGGVVYRAGDSFILDDQKVTVSELS